MKKFVTMGLGIVIGLAMAGPVALAAEYFLKAYPSTQTFYVDGNPAELEAYAINGYNYVKLRDIGQAVGFNVYYDAENNAAMMESDQPYTGEAPQKNMASPGNDHSAQANSTIFNGELTREAYNGIRSTVLGLESKTNGTVVPIASSAERKMIEEVLAAIGLYPKFSLANTGDGSYVCAVKHLDVYAPAVKHTQSFVDGLSGKSQKAQIEEIVWYVCDRLTYGIEYPFVDEVLSQDGQVRGCYMAYAYCFQFLCNRADIPCLLVSNIDHQWNRVYVDAQWWDVDVTGADVPDTSLRSYITILHPLGEYATGKHADALPGVTAFAMELLAPGSTK